MYCDCFQFYHAAFYYIFVQLVSRVLPGRHMSGGHLHLLRQLRHANLFKMVGHSYDEYNGRENLFLRYRYLWHLVEGTVDDRTLIHAQLN